MARPKKQKPDETGAEAAVPAGTASQPETQSAPKRRGRPPGVTGRVPGSGRKAGLTNAGAAAKRFAKGDLAREKALASGISPLEFLLGIMRDTKNTMEVRIDVAKATLPFVHPRLAQQAIAVQHRISLDTMSEEQLADLIGSCDAVLAGNPLPMLSGPVIDADPDTDQSAETSVNALDNLKDTVKSKA